jgi:dihydrolipoamide dehydrogenase
MKYDLCVIGGGWAGFNAAQRASKLGKKVCLIEDKEIGGTCLNRGCIPTKAWVAYSKQNYSFPDIQTKASQIIERLRQGMQFVLKSRAIDYINGKAKIVSCDTVRVGEDQEIKAKFILIATGSTPRELPDLKFDHQKINSTDDILSWEQLPKNLLIIGGGVIGCEFATIFKRLGVEVTILEIESQLLPGIDGQLSKKIAQVFQKAGIKIELQKKHGEIDLNNFEKILLSVGRKSSLDGLWEDSGYIRTEKDSIVVDHELKTNIPNIFAAGDCIGGYMLAHVASYEGELAVKNMFSEREKKDYSVVPVSIFTSPEIASVGISEEKTKLSVEEYRIATVNYLSIGMAHIFGDTQGFVKVIVGTRSGRILGANIIGLEATELVNIFSIMIKNNLTIQDLRKTIFAHPSISEIIAEVAKVLE